MTEFAILSSLDAVDRQRVLAAARRRKFARDDVIFWAGDPGDSLHLIAAGHVAVQITTPRCDVATVRILGPGQHFGELALVAPAPRSATMRALDPVETLVVTFAEFQALRADPEIERIFVEALAVEIRRLSAVLTDALYLPAVDLLWKRLAGIEAVFATSAAETELPLTQSTIATVAGVSRQTASKFFDQAESCGVIRRDPRGRVTVVDREALHARARSR
ncbi:MAG: Crp/Fnr family transcriptional regulator [Acidimicrobiia bacterium]